MPIPVEAVMISIYGIIMSIVGIVLVFLILFVDYIQNKIASKS
jgi:Na+-transporting methylmalonyl-CoA/oxaloacetate decarboxylase gamma subunit